MPILCCGSSNLGLRNAILDLVVVLTIRDNVLGAPGLGHTEHLYRRQFVAINA